jgi:uncharacterized protein (TIGR00255 family)
MIRSMTGFGTAAGRVGAAQVTVEIRTVNHRFFTPTIKLPGSLGRFEGEVREVLRQKIGRGHVTLYCRYERDEERPSVTIDEQRFAHFLVQLRGLQLRHSLGPVDVGSILRLPDVVTGEARDPAGEGTVEELVAIVSHAVGALMTMRADEGARLAGFLLERLRIIDAALQRLAARAPARTIEHRDRLRAAVRELTEGLAVDETRLAQEIAILAERMDVQEELDRFGSHIEAFEAAIRESGGEPVGKRLGFLLQEMLREANTTGSKAADATMLRDVVVIKEELERIREQVENVE